MGYLVIISTGAFVTTIGTAVLDHDRDVSSCAAGIGDSLSVLIVYSVSFFLHHQWYSVSMLENNLLSHH